MLETAIQEVSSGADLFIAAAAVADYRPVEMASTKLKKTGAELSLQLVQNPDIVQTVATASYRPTLVIGFAAETDNVAAYANEKLMNKNLDAIVANDVSRQDIGFNSDYNAISLWSRSGCEMTVEGTKLSIAVSLVQRFSDMLSGVANQTKGQLGD